MYNALLSYVQDKMLYILSCTQDDKLKMYSKWLLYSPLEYILLVHKLTFYTSIPNKFFTIKPITKAKIATPMDIVAISKKRFLKGRSCATDT